MQKTTIALIAGVGALLAATTAASAGTYCDDNGYCREERSTRVYQSYNYEPGYYEPGYSQPGYSQPEYYGRRTYREARPGVYIRAPGVSIGIGGW